MTLRSLMNSHFRVARPVQKRTKLKALFLYILAVKFSTQTMTGKLFMLYSFLRQFNYGNIIHVIVWFENLVLGYKS